MKEIFLLLHNIRSVHNVGAIFRTADAAGITKIILSGYTPRPLDRFGREVKELSKVALGGEVSVKWEYKEDPIFFLKELKSKGVKIISIEQDERSVDYKKVEIQETSLIIMGNEVDGVSKEMLDLSDIIAEIPMKGNKESLNVAVSCGIALYRLLNI